MLPLLVTQMGPNRPAFPGSYILLLVVAVILITVAVFLFLFPRLERVRPTEDIEPRVKREAPEEAGREEAGSSLETALRLLDTDERLVVEALVDSGGSMLQKDISYEFGFSRVKTHRVLVRLIKRGVVTAEKHFNTNRIELAGWLRNKEGP